jgi:VIT1/CCC1 family predicted Fe2+/Mn2+ transporter
VRQVWEATLATFAAKFVVSATFVVPVIISPLDQAMVISIVWGLFLLTVLSFFIARAQTIAPWKVIGEHLLIALCVVAMTHAVGDWVNGFVGEE